MNPEHSPIENYLDDLLRRTRADARTTRRLLADATEHLYASADDLERTGLERVEAETEAVKRFGPVEPIADAASRRTLVRLVTDTTRGAVYLGSCGLIAIGISGLVALVMNMVFGRSFVGGAAPFPGGGSGPSATEVADDAVTLRILAGLVGLVILVGYLAWQRSHPHQSMLPGGMIDALGAAAFIAATIGLAAIAVTQTHPAGTPGAGFALSGALVALPAAALFAARSARALLAT